MKNNKLTFNNNNRGVEANTINNNKRICISTRNKAKATSSRPKV